MKQHLTNDEKVTYCGKWWSPKMGLGETICLRCKLVRDGEYYESVALGPNPSKVSDEKGNEND